MLYESLNIPNVVANTATEADMAQPRVNYCNEMALGYSKHLSSLTAVDQSRRDQRFPPSP